jgi:hypothetical protein
MDERPPTTVGQRALDDGAAQEPLTPAGIGSTVPGD